VDEPIAGGSDTEGAGAAHTNTQVDLTAEGPAQEAESSAGTTEAQRPEASGEVKGSIPTFDNIDDDLT
jgi:hypothetical protein